MANQHRINIRSIVTDSFSLVMHHCILFIYSLIFLSIPALGIAFRYFNIPTTHTPEYAYSVISQANNAESVIIMLLITLFFILLYFVAACITIHTFALLNHQHASVGSTLKKFAGHIPRIAIWAIITTISTYSGLALYHMLTLRFQDVTLFPGALGILLFTVSFLWNVVIFFMVPIISLEEYSLLQSLKRSCILAKKHIIQIIEVKILYVGAVFIISLLLIPLVLIFQNFIILSENYQSLVQEILSSLFFMLLFTVSTVLITKCYKEVLE